MTDLSINLARAITLLQPARVEVGAGTAARLGPWAAAYKRVFVLTAPATAPLISSWRYFSLSISRGKYK